MLVGTSATLYGFINPGVVPDDVRIPPKCLRKQKKEKWLGGLPQSVCEYKIWQRSCLYPQLFMSDSLDFPFVHYGYAIDSPIFVI